MLHRNSIDHSVSRQTRQDDPRGLSYAKDARRRWHLIARKRPSALVLASFLLLFGACALYLLLQAYNKGDTIHIALAIDSLHSGGLLALINSTLINKKTSSPVLWHVLTGEEKLNVEIKGVVGRLLPHARLHSHLLKLSEQPVNITVWEPSRSGSLSKVSRLFV
jgi:hypothetical protein